MYCAAILDSLGAGERGGFFCGICGSLLTARADLVPLVPDRDERDEPTPTQEASPPQPRLKTPSSGVGVLGLGLHIVRFVLAMQLPPSNPVRALPANAAAWSRAAAATHDGHYVAWGAGTFW